MRRPGWRATTATAAVLLLAAVCVWALVSGFDWLDTGEEPHHADLLVVLGGGSGERFRTAIGLYQQGLAPRVLITDPFGFPALVMTRLEAAGISRRALLAPPMPSSSTLEDALAIRQLVVRNKLDSILVVTSPYHCRRARLILRRVLSGLPVKLAVSPSVSLYMDPERWWRSHQGWITVGPEFPKLLWAWMTVPEGSGVGRSGPVN